MKAEQLNALAPVSTLAPRTSAKERKSIRQVISKVVRQASHEYAGNDLLEHVYCAGLWHGASLTQEADHG